MRDVQSGFANSACGVAAAALGVEALGVEAFGVEALGAARSTGGRATACRRSLRSRALRSFADGARSTATQLSPSVRKPRAQMSGQTLSSCPRSADIRSSEGWSAGSLA